MKRWLGWTVVLGLGGALAAGCVQNQEQGAKVMGPPYTPEQQKYKSPPGSDAESPQGGSGSAGLSTGDRWQTHPDSAAREDQGPYMLSQPQPVPRERRAAPLGVGSGTDSARKMAMDQLK
ncbi:hypothetical protein JRI60_06725 [Archangium violaceum]|uniref:hypothetical protein n=1 Tax=Archangium violaceum TaxID=83451 RepID=UPI00194F059E|nr:hypothetical protein [Archangium violaceum]QRN98721.1 hypothetical protein JRI60_06725 [Archangium violaceum]